MKSWGVFVILTCVLVHGWTDEPKRIPIATDIKWLSQNRFAILGIEGDLAVADLETGKLIFHRIPGATGKLLALGANRFVVGNGRQIAICEVDDQSISSRSVRRLTSADKSWYLSMFFLPKSNAIVLWEWQSTPTQRIHLIDLEQPESAAQTYSFAKPLTALAVSADRPELLAGMEDELLKLSVDKEHFARSTIANRLSLGTGKRISAITYCEESRFAQVLVDRQANLFDLTAFKKVSSLMVQGYELAAAWTEQDVIVFDSDRGFGYWDGKSDQSIRRFIFDKPDDDWKYQNVRAIARHPTQLQLAYLQQNSRPNGGSHVRLMDMKSGKVLNTIEINWPAQREQAPSVFDPPPESPRKNIYDVSTWPTEYRDQTPRIVRQAADRRETIPEPIEDEALRRKLKFKNPLIRTPIQTQPKDGIHWSYQYKIGIERGEAITIELHQSEHAMTRRLPNV